MEYMLVRFTESRGVIVNGSPQGKTNVVIELEEGTHTVTLQPPPDFTPRMQTVVLNGTTPLSPHELTFSATPPAQ